MRARWTTTASTGAGRTRLSCRFTTRDALQWATVNGARALGMDDRIGSLAPGRQADVIVVGPGNGRLNMLGLADPVGAVVQQADPSNVQAVLVAGRPVKRDGRSARRRSGARVADARTIA